jgi:hypothetical protein
LSASFSLVSASILGSGAAAAPFAESAGCAFAISSMR